MQPTAEILTKIVAKIVRPAEAEHHRIARVQLRKHVLLEDHELLHRPQRCDGEVLHVSVRQPLLHEIGDHLPLSNTPAPHERVAQHVNVAAFMRRGQLQRRLAKAARVVADHRIHLVVLETSREVGPPTNADQAVDLEEHAECVDVAPPIAADAECPFTEKTREEKSNGEQQQAGEDRVGDLRTLTQSRLCHR